MQSRNELDLTVQVERSLLRSDFTFHREVPLAGIVADFLVEAPSGKEMVVEVRQWPSHPTATQRAIHQAKRYSDLLGGQDYVLVVDGIERSLPLNRIVQLKDLPDFLRKWASPGTALPNRMAARKTARARSTPQRRTVVPQHKSNEGKRAERTKKYVFAAMPFEKKYDDVFFVAMSGAARALKVGCERIDQSPFVGDIVTAIRKKIAGAFAVIADLSQAKPNVLYEVGYAHALGKPTIHISSTPLSTLPFDVKTWNTVSYQVGQTYALKSLLTRHLKGVLNAR